MTSTKRSRVVSRKFKLAAVRRMVDQADRCRVTPAKLFRFRRAVPAERAVAGTRLPLAKS
jgi:hypothetical protein